MQTETTDTTAARDWAVITRALIRDEVRETKRELAVISDRTGAAAKPLAEAVLGAIFTALHDWDLHGLDESIVTVWHAELELIRRESAAIGVAIAGVMPIDVPGYSAIAPVEALANARSFRRHAATVAQATRADMAEGAAGALVAFVYSAMMERLPRFASTAKALDSINDRAIHVATTGHRAINTQRSQRSLNKRLN